MKITKSSEAAWRKSGWSLYCLAIFFAFLGAPQPPAFAADSQDALDRVIDLNIPAHMALEDALIEWGIKAGVTVMINSRTVNWQVTQEVRGSLTARKALTELLEGSGLWYSNDGGRILIVPKNPLLPSGLWEGGAEPPRLLTSSDGNQDSSAPGGLDSSTSTDSSRQEHLNEVVVTAQKREERLQDVPVPVTAISGTVLASSNQIRVQDYYSQIPGLNLALIGAEATPVISIRGVTTGGYTNPTVGIMVDDVPYGSSTSEGAGYSVPDIDPSDLARVEVLRGPQGTLYGASSIGGLLKFVTVDPSVSDLTGQLQVGGEHIWNGHELGYNVRGSINVPLGDTFAIRASAHSELDPGYIDNIETGKMGVNAKRSDGGRVSALWLPTDGLSVKLSALIQDSRREGADDVQEGLGPLQQSELLGTGGYERKTQAYSATVKFKQDSSEFTSATGYSVDRYFISNDVTSSFGGVGGLASLYGVTGASAPFEGMTRKVTQEFRFSVPLATRLDWLMGVFYTHEAVQQPSEFLAVDPTTGDVAGTLLANNVPSTFQEYAAFTDFTVHVTDQLDIQLGGRKSRDSQSFSSSWTGPYVSTFGLSNQPEMSSSDSPFTYLITPKLTLSPDMMTYARIASGYRPGGPNGTCTTGIPCQFGADKTQNYDLGVKGDVADHLLTFDASIYYIDWKNIQLSLVDASGSVGYTGNGSRAKSQGVELSVQANPIQSFSVSAWVAYNDAQLSENPPTGGFIAHSGDRLPYSGRWSANVTLNQDFRVGSDTTVFVGASSSYVDKRLGNFAGVFSSSPDRQVFPAYVQVDLRSGVRYFNWTSNFFINNVADRRGVLAGGLDNPDNPAIFQLIQPRTIGLSLTRSF